MTLVVQHFVDNINDSATFISLYTLELVLVLTQLSGAMPTVFVSHLNTILLIMDNLFAIYFVNICSNNMPLTI